MEFIELSKNSIIKLLNFNPQHLKLIIPVCVYRDFTRTGTDTSGTYRTYFIIINLLRTYGPDSGIRPFLSSGIRVPRNRRTTCTSTTHDGDAVAHC